MKLQAVTVSVNYADFLDVVAQENKKNFDKWIIITDTKDLATKEVCDKHGLECIQTDSFYANGAKFNKWAGLNEGLDRVDKDAWCLIIDGDIVLHHLTRRTLEKLNLDSTFIYGMDRLDCIGFEAWDHYKESAGILKENWLLHTSGLKLGARLVHHYGMEGENGRFEGWRPLGFFQLMHRSAFDRHPQDSDSADHCDLTFARQWPRDKRMLIPELFAIHLISEDGRKGQNWRGRKSKPFKLAKEGNDILGSSIQTPIESVIETLVEKKSPVLIEEFNPAPLKRKHPIIRCIRRLFKRLLRFLLWVLKIIFRFFCNKRRHYYY